MVANARAFSARCFGGPLVGLDQLALFVQPALGVHRGLESCRATCRIGSGPLGTPWCRPEASVRIEPTGADSMLDSTWDPGVRRDDVEVSAGMTARGTMGGTPPYDGEGGLDPTVGRAGLEHATQGL